MADTFLLQLVSPERILVEEQVSEAQIPAYDGYIGVLPGHAPLLSQLKAGGVLTYRTGGVEKVLAVYGGFVEVLGDRVRVLADAAEPREEIDLAKAQLSFADASKMLSGGGIGPGSEGGEAIDPAVALDEAMRAEAKVEAANRK